MTAWSGCEEAVFGFLFLQDQTSTSLSFFITDLLLCVLSVLMLTKFVKELSDNELIKKCFERSENWNQFWGEFERRFGRYILGLIISELKKYWSSFYLHNFKEAVQEIQQEVYATLLKNGGKALRQFRGERPESFHAYLKIISVNQTKNFINSELKRRRRNTNTVSHTDEYSTYDIPIYSNNTNEDLQEEFAKEHIIQTLRAHYPSRNLKRDLMMFRLYFFEGLSSKQIAQTFKIGLTVSGVETVVSRMKIALEKVYFDKKI